MSKYLPLIMCATYALLSFARFDIMGILVFVAFAVVYFMARGQHVVEEG